MDKLPVTSLRVLVGVMLITAATALAAAAPFVPDSDSQILERLPFAPGDPVLRRLRGLNDQLTRTPKRFAAGGPGRTGLRGAGPRHG
jgi:hypothetical protein